VNEADLVNRFKFHPANTDKRKTDHETIRDRCLTLSLIFNNLCPDGRELSLAVTSLEDAMFWANAAIARKSED
jgi:hypothetical protein